MRRTDLIVAWISRIFNVRICYYEGSSYTSLTYIIPLTDSFFTLVKFYCFDCVDNTEHIEMAFSIFRM